MLSHDEVRAIADLARLELTDAEVAMYTSQLSAILADFQRLQQLDTSHIPPTASVLPLKSVMRQDEPATPLTPEEVTANAPQAFADQFQVGAVLADE